MSTFDTVVFLACWCVMWTFGFMSFHDAWRGRERKETLSSSFDFILAAWYLIYPVWIALRMYTEVYVL